MIDERGLHLVTGQEVVHTGEPPMNDPVFGLLAALIQQSYRDVLRGEPQERLDAAHWLLTVAPLLVQAFTRVEPAYFRRCIERTLPTALVQEANRLVPEAAAALSASVYQQHTEGEHER